MTPGGQMRYGGGGAMGIRGNVLRPAFGTAGRGGIVIGGDNRTFGADEFLEDWFQTADLLNPLSGSWTTAGELPYTFWEGSNYQGFSYGAACSENESGGVLYFKGLTRNFVDLWYFAQRHILLYGSTTRTWRQIHLGLADHDGSRMLAIRIKPPFGSPRAYTYTSMATSQFGLDAWIHVQGPRIEYWAITTKAWIFIRFGDFDRAAGQAGGHGLGVGSILYFGGVSGITGQGGPLLTETVLKLSTISHSMTVFGPTSNLLARYGMAGGVIDGKMILAGGRSQAGPTSVVHSYDPTTQAMTSLGSLEVGAVDAASFVAGRPAALYVCGGQRGETGESMRTYQKYTSGTDTWLVTGGNMSERRSHAAGATV